MNYAVLLAIEQMVQLDVGASAVKTTGKSDQILSRRVRQAKFRQFLRVVQHGRAGDVTTTDSHLLYLVTP